MKTFLLSLLATCALCAEVNWLSDRISAEQYNAVPTSVPVVKSNALVSVHLASHGGHPSFSVHSLNGSLLARFRVEVPGATEVWPGDLTPHADGSGFVATLTAVQAGRRSALLAFVDAKGNLEKLVKTTPFLAMQVVATRDGSVWALGEIVSRNGDPNSPEPILYRFSKEGTLLGKSIPRNRFRTVEGSLQEPHLEKGGAVLLASGNRVGLWVGQTEEWIELDENGEIRRSVVARLPQVVRSGKSTGQANGASGVAMTADGAVYARLRSGEQLGIYCLRPGSSEWAVAIPQTAMVTQGIYSLWGAAGDQLVIGQNAPSGLLEFRLLAKP